MAKNTGLVLGVIGGAVALGVGYLIWKSSQPTSTGLNGLDGSIFDSIFGGQSAAQRRAMDSVAQGGGATWIGPGAEMRAWQAKLQAIGYRVPQSGRWDRATAAAITNFAVAHHFPTGATIFTPHGDAASVSNGVLSWLAAASSATGAPDAVAVHSR